MASSAATSQPYTPFSMWAVLTVARVPSTVMAVEIPLGDRFGYAFNLEGLAAALGAMGRTTEAAHNCLAPWTYSARAWAHHCSRHFSPFTRKP
ncbi:MAG TPA: hypothetical protein VNL71_06085 [Chloroflexota bacterium]|nr:hypothetical protein [Chloroflexota bacterium]